MDKDKLIVEDGNDYKYRLWWFIAEEQDIGGCVGEGGVREDEPKTPNDAVEQADYFAAIRAAKASPNVLRDSLGFYWESRSEAEAARRLCNVEIKVAQSDKPWPDWAKQALNAGWKAPKGWKP